MKESKDDIYQGEVKLIVEVEAESQDKANYFIDYELSMTTLLVAMYRISLRQSHTMPR